MSRSARHAEGGEESRWPLDGEGSRRKGVTRAVRESYVARAIREGIVITRVVGEGIAHRKGHSEPSIRRRRTEESGHGSLTRSQAMPRKKKAP